MWCWSARHDDEEAGREAGFTLVELLVVILVVGILVGLSIPTLLGSRQQASDTAAQTRVRMALTTQKAFFTDRGTWGQAVDIAPEEPALRFEQLGPTGAQNLGTVYVQVDAGAATMVTRSATGTCYWVRTASPAAPTFAKQPCSVTPATSDYAAAW